MVRTSGVDQSTQESFQYSLCRVVLMVSGLQMKRERGAGLSVLALSSRFDGHIDAAHGDWQVVTFSTRSVESF